MTLRFDPKCLYLGMICLLCSSCYNFKGISIPPEINSYYVETFSLIDQSAPADLHQLFTERLREKIREESRLVNDNDDPDVVFTGSVKSFSIIEAAPQEDNTVSLNRLQITVEVQYSNERDEESNWKKSYNAFEDFDATIDLQSIQDGIIENLIEDMTERIFNDSFTNW